MAAEKTLTGTTKWINQGVAAICALLLVACVYLVVKMAYLLLGGSFGGEAPQLYGVAPVKQTQQSPQRAQVDTSALSRWNLFGSEVVKQTTEKPEMPEEAAETTLPLELHGVFVAEQEENSTAIISERNRDSKLYHVDDDLPGGVSLAEVRADSVLLNRNGEIEALYFPKNAKSMQRSSRNRSSASRSYSSSSSSSSAARGSVRSSGGYARKMENVIRSASSATEVADALREEMNARSPDAALQDLGLQTNGGRGYKIKDSGSAMFAAIGGRPGDVILSINGKSLGDPAADLGMAEQLMSDCNATISMERNGHTFTNKLSLCAD